MHEASTRSPGRIVLTDVPAGDDGADRLVAEDPAVGYLGYVTAEDVQVGSADGDRIDADDGVGGVDRLGIRHRLPVLLTGSVIDERVHGGTSS